MRPATCPLASLRYDRGAMYRQRPRSWSDIVDPERAALTPSLVLATAITAIVWLAIALVLGLGRAGLGAAGGVGSGAEGLAVWVVLWIGMWAAITIAIGGGLVAGFRVWVALYPVVRDVPSSRAAAHGAAEERRSAVAEAEAVLRRDHR